MDTLQKNYTYLRMYYNTTFQDMKSRKSASPNGYSSCPRITCSIFQILIEILAGNRRLIKKRRIGITKRNIYVVIWYNICK